MLGLHWYLQSPWLYFPLPLHEIELCLASSPVFLGGCTAWRGPESSVVGFVTQVSCLLDVLLPGKWREGEQK